MTARTVLIAAGAFVAFGLSPAMAGGDCPLGGHAYSPATVVDAEQSKPADTQTSSIPYPVPTLAEDTLTASVEDEATKTTTE